MKSSFFSMGFNCIRLGPKVEIWGAVVLVFRIIVFFFLINLANIVHKPRDYWTHERAPTRCTNDCDSSEFEIRKLGWGAAGDMDPGFKRFCIFFWASVTYAKSAHDSFRCLYNEQKNTTHFCVFLQFLKKLNRRIPYKMFSYL